MRVIVEYRIPKYFTKESMRMKMRVKDISLGAAHSFNRVMRRVALEAMDERVPMHIMYATVKSLKPLQIQVDQKLILESPHVLFTSKTGNYVINGAVMVIIGKDEILLNEGDCIYFDATIPHGMVAVGGADCKFLAVLI